MKTFGKSIIGSAAVGAMALAFAAPAKAQERYRDYRDDNRINAGEIIAGAVILGGIAAATGALRGNRGYDYRYDDRYNDRYTDRYNWRDGYQRGSSRQAVERCVLAAEQDAARYTYGRADVTRITDVDQRRDGYRVRGEIAVGRDGRYNGWGGDWRDRDSYRSRGDSGRFTCDVRYGRILNLDYSGLRGLR